MEGTDYFCEKLIPEYLNTKDKITTYNLYIFNK